MRLSAIPLHRSRPAEIHHAGRPLHGFESSRGLRFDEPLATEKDVEELSTPKGRIRCRSCATPITTEQDRIAMHGAHRHEFTNPAGFKFQIGCFSTVENCLAFGEPTTEHTWFEGFYWQIAICQSCKTHLGWRFTRVDGDTFFALILSQLALPH